MVGSCHAWKVYNLGRIEKKSKQNELCLIQSTKRKTLNKIQELTKKSTNLH